jgi:alanyl-tRNA synthetase
MLKSFFVCVYFFTMQKYGLPESRIHATYFTGDTSSGLSPDNESKTALQKCIGEERILPSMSKEDFWMSGETGPCGPSVGIFVDGSNSQDGVNGKFIEISRTVFVEFNRQADGVLSPLQAKHIITGINLQCLAAILQKKESLYELDDYDNIIDCISSGQ